MLLCALIVWAIFPFEYENNLRHTYLTKIDCENYLINHTEDSNKFCMKIDKRVDFSFIEWNEDNCGLSEHIWTGN